MASKGLLLNAKKKKTPLKVKKDLTNLILLIASVIFKWWASVWFETACLISDRLQLNNCGGFRHFDFYAYAYARFKDHSSLNPQTVKQI